MVMKVGQQQSREFQIFRTEVLLIKCNHLHRFLLQQPLESITLCFVYMSILGFPWAKQRGVFELSGLACLRIILRVALAFHLAGQLECETGFWTWRQEGIQLQRTLSKVWGDWDSLHWHLSGASIPGTRLQLVSSNSEQKRMLRIPAMLRAILLFLAARFEEGGQLQEPPPLTDEGNRMLVAGSLSGFQKKCPKSGRHG